MTNIAFLTVRDGKAVLIPVEKGPAYDGYVVVTGDVRPGEPVVVEGNERLQPGQAVLILSQVGDSKKTDAKQD